MSENKKLEGPIEVVMHYEDGVPVTRIYKQVVNHFTRLGKEIKISPKANVTINKPGFEVKFFDETVSINIGIGKDHTADLIMDKDAWEALNAGEKISITTTEEFKKKVVYKAKKK